MRFQGTKNFSIKELEASTTANQLKIDNSIPDEYMNNAERLLKFLQGIRDAWGSGIRIISGFRCDALNKAVNGSKTSAHKTCNAADLYPVNEKFEEFKEFIVKYLEGSQWDQCIVEKSEKSQWIHFGLYNNYERQRRQIFALDV